MKPGWILSLVTALSFSPAFAGGEEWSRDFAKARTAAASENKDLLVDFTGSDWCSWCIKLNKEVFGHEAFRTGVKDSFVLVELDFPQDKNKMSEAEQAQNAALLKTYPVKGYPTILLCDAAGKPYAATGYQAGGPEKYVAHLTELKARRAARDTAFAKAAEAKGVDRAKTLVGALEAMELDDAMLLASYPEVVSQIKEADPDDVTGFTRKAAGKQKLASFMEQLGAWQKKGDPAAAMEFINKSLKEPGLPPDVNQHMHGHKAALFLHQSKPSDAVTTLEQGIAVAPDSPVAAELDKFLKFVKKQAEDEEKK